MITSLQAIQARRAQCENRDLDPVVWTSHRVIKWIRDIDLKVGKTLKFMYTTTEKSEVRLVRFFLKD